MSYRVCGPSRQTVQQQNAEQAAQQQQQCSSSGGQQQRSGSISYRNRIRPSEGEALAFAHADVVKGFAWGRWRREGVGRAHQRPPLLAPDSTQRRSSSSPHRSIPTMHPQYIHIYIYIALFSIGRSPISREALIRCVLISTFDFSLQPDHHHDINTGHRNRYK